MDDNQTMQPEQAPTQSKQSNNGKGRAVAIALGVVILFLLILGTSLGWFGFSGGETDYMNDREDDVTQNENLPSGITIVEEEPGDGATAVPGKLITVHYTGTFEDGTVFDSSVQRGEPFVFLLGAGQVIEGWDRGVVGMQVGGTRTLRIAPEYAYGDMQNGPIPPNSTLIFEIELLDVSEPVGGKG